MAMVNPDDVLADLKRVGAVGGPKTPAISEAAIESIEIERGAPGPVLRDLRGGRAVGAIDNAVRHLDDAVRALEGVRESLVHLRQVWEPVGEDEEGVFEAMGPPETALGSLEEEESPPIPGNSPTPLGGAQSPAAVDPEALAAAREMARRKILGENMPPEHRAKMEAEDDVPFVGQDRALPPGRGPEEITIGTVGRIKPSFPVEE